MKTQVLPEVQYKKYIYEQIWLEYLLSLQSWVNKKLNLNILQFSVDQTWMSVL